MKTAARSDGILVTAGLSALLFLVPLAFGGVHMWAGAVLQIFVWWLSTAWYFRRRLRFSGNYEDRTPTFFVLAASALIGFLGLQLLPLPPGILHLVSPEAAEIYARTDAAFDSVRVPDLPIRPVRSAADQTVPVELRERIRGFAAEVQSAQSTSGRSIALDPFRSRFELFRYIAYGLVLWMAATSPQPRLLLGAIGLAGVAMSLLAIVERATWNGLILWFFAPYDSGPKPNFNRMLGPFVNADHFSAFVALAIGPTLALLVRQARQASPRRRRKRGAELDPVRIAVVTTGLAIMVAALLGSSSRGGMFGALLSCVAVWMGRAKNNAPIGGWKVVRGRERKNRVARARRFFDRVLPPVLMIAVLLAGVTYVGPENRELLDQRLARTVYGNDLEPRLIFWRQTLPVIADFKLVGTGLGGWSEAVQRYQEYPNVWYRQNHSHNDYLEWIVEVGAVGLTLTALLGLAFSVWAWRNRQIPVLVRAGLIGSVAAIAWHEVFDFVLRVPANAVLLSVVLGLLCNRNWDSSHDEAEGQGRERPDVFRSQARYLSRLQVIGAVILAFVASLQSIGWVLEFREWKRVRDGDPNLVRAPREAETWEKLELFLSRSGLRHQPPTIECLLTAARLSPTAEHAVYRLSRTLPLIGDRLHALEAALFLDPTRSEWRLEYAAALEQVGRLPEALLAIEEAVRLDPVLARHPYAFTEDRIVSAEVVAAVERGFRRAIDHHGEVPEILAGFAKLMKREGRFTEAADLWRRAAESSEDWARYGVQAGEALAEAKDYINAEATLRRVIAAAPEYPPAYRALAISVFQAQGRLEDTEKTLVLGAQRSPRRAELYVTLAGVHWSNGENAKFLAALAKAADAERGNAIIHGRLGAAYLNAGDYHRARSTLARAIRLDGQQAQFHSFLGMAQEKLHELGDAKLAYQTAVELDPGNESYRLALARISAALAKPSERGDAVP